MEYKGVEYTLRPQADRHEWTWTIYPKNSLPREGHVAGTREHAELAAIRAIENLIRERNEKK
jgi:hypothetical protein